MTNVCHSSTPRIESVCAFQAARGAQGAGVGDDDAAGGVGRVDALVVGRQGEGADWRRVRAQQVQRRRRRRRVRHGFPQVAIPTIGSDSCHNHPLTFAYSYLSKSTNYLPERTTPSKDVHTLKTHRKIKTRTQTS